MIAARASLSIGRLSFIAMSCLLTGCTAIYGYAPEAAQPRAPSDVPAETQADAYVMELPRPNRTGNDPGRDGGIETHQSRELHLRDASDPSNAANPSVRGATLEQVVRTANADAFDVLRAAAQLERASGQAQTAIGELLPRVSLGGSASYMNGAQVGSFGKLRSVDFARYEPAATLFFRSNPGAAATLTSATRRQAEAAALDVREAQREAMQEAALAYQNLVLARASMAIADQLAADASTFYEIARTRAETGLGSGADVARAQAELARTEQTRIRARAAWEETSIRLATLLRWPTRTLIDPQQSEVRAIALIDDRDTARLVHTATEARPDLQAAQKRATAASKRESAAWWDFLGPDLDLGVRERFVGTDAASLDDTFIAYAFIGFTFDFSEAGRVRSAAGEKRTMAVRADALSEQVRADVHHALSQVRAARTAIPQARIEVEATERGYRIQRDRFEAGTGLGLEVIESQNAKARARLSAVEAILRLNSAQVELAAATGHLSPDLFH